MKLPSKKQKSRTRTFKIKVGYIDNSYWDDGNRSTTDLFTFSKKKDRDLKLSELMASKKIRTFGQQGGEQDFRINWMQKIDTTTTQTVEEMDLGL